MQHRRHRLARALSVGLLAITAPGFALAATAAQEPGEGDARIVDGQAIMVTAQKREQQVHEVPIAISAYSGEFLDQYNVRDVSDIGNLVPGLVVQEQSPNNPGFVIRGITSDSGEATVEPRVSVFQDGVSISKSRGSIVQPFDLERVEVLRGPQGTLFGRGAQIGAVHFIQNKASSKHESGYSVGLGNHGSHLATAHANVPFSDSFAGRVAVYREQRDGYVENLSGGDLNGKDTFAVRGSLRWNLRQTDTVDLIVNWQKDTPPGTAFRSGTIPTRSGSLDVLDGKADLNRGEQLGLDRSVRGVSLLGNFSLGSSWSLSSITGWRDFDSHEEFDGDGAQVFVAEFAELAEGEQLSQEFRFNYDGGGRFTGFTGLSYFSEEGSQTVPLRTNERSLVTMPILGLGIPTLLPDGSPNTLVTMLPIAPGVVLPLKPFHEEDYANFGKTQAWEVFADGTWALNERLNLSAGLRATFEDVTAGYSAGFYGVPSALGQLPINGAPAFPNLLYKPAARREHSETFNSLVGRLVADYQFSEALRGYASFSRGRRPNVIDVDASSVTIVDDEIVLSSEIGLKGIAAQGRLGWDLALFHYDYSNFQTMVRDDQSLRYVAANGGNASALGGEFSLSWRASERFNAFFNYGFVDATFDDRDDNGNVQELAGNRFRLTPRHSAAAGAEWVLPQGNRQWYLRPSVSWRSHVYFEDDNTAGIEQDSYALVNLKAGVRLADGRWDIGVWANNLADEKFLIDGGNTGRLFGSPTFIQGAPRMYGLTLSGRF